MVTVVLPSPSSVGVIAVTSTSNPRAARSLSASSLILALWRPKGSTWAESHAQLVGDVRDGPQAHRLSDVEAE